VRKARPKGKRPTYKIVLTLVELSHYFYYTFGKGKEGLFRIFENIFKEVEICGTDKFGLINV